MVHRKRKSRVLGGSCADDGADGSAGGGRDPLSSLSRPSMARLRIIYAS